MAVNVYFELTRAFNADGAVVALASGQAVVIAPVSTLTAPPQNRIWRLLPASHRRCGGCPMPTTALSRWLNGFSPRQCSSRSRLMTMLSDDDLNLGDLTEEELALAWDLWFDLAQTTNEDDPPYTHGVFQTARLQQEPAPRSERTIPGARPDLRANPRDS